MIDVPSYKLPEKNIFNFRNREWNDNLIENIVSMSAVFETYGLKISSIKIENKDKIDISEIKRTNSKMLNISFIYNNGEEAENFDISYEIPWLINNHFYIGGNWKVCLYQLFDKPVVIRKNLIKIRTNIHSFTVEKSEKVRRKYNYVFHMFSKKIPFSKAIIAYYGVDKTRENFNINDNNEYTGNSTNSNFRDLISDIILILNDQSIDKTRLFASEFPKKPDQMIIEDLNIITKIDIFSFKFFNAPSIIEEFIYQIENNAQENLDYNNKRIRFVEQIIYVQLCKDFYNILLSIKKNRKLKFSVNSKSILSALNVSNIVQFDSSLNPLSELSLFLRTSLSGPGGFEKSNVPQYLREIHPSMINIIDPADTADRDGCGTTQYLLPNVTIDENGAMIKQNDSIVNSIAISCVPFHDKDDATRLQMSSSQQRHSIMLKEFDNALIQTGIEGMYSDQTTYMFKAKRNGKVIHLDNEMIVIQYDNKMSEVFHIGYRKLYLSIYDFYKVYFKENDTFKKGDIIAESNYLKNGRIVIGRNLLTAVMVYHGYNYEDGIVISDKLVKDDVFTSVHYIDLSFEIPKNKILLNLNSDYSDYKPLPDLYQQLKIGDIYAKIKSISSLGFEDVIFEPVSEQISDENCVITDIKIYANSWNTELPQYDNFIKTKVEEQKKKKQNLINTLSKFLTKDELDKYLSILEINKTEKNNNYKVKGESVDGVRFEITAKYERKILVGDKVGNRHGNKGIISKIVPEDKMPVLPDGRKVEIIINPLGIMSRMNSGQLFELHLAMSLVDLKSKVKEMYSQKKDEKDIYKYVIDYIKIIDKTENNNYTTQMVEFFKNVKIESFINNIDNFFIIQPPFESINKKDLTRAMEYTNTKYEYEVFDPILNQKLENEIGVGYQYFLKLNHIAEDKISSRGIGPYSAKTAQPLGGKTRKGGQRLGEMEMWAVIAHGAEKNLCEFISTKSDSIKKRNKYLSSKIGNDELLLETDDDSVPQSLRLLQTNLKTLGLDYKLNEEEM